MNKYTELEQLLRSAATHTPAPDPELLWAHIVDGLEQPGRQIVPFRTLRNIGISAILLVSFNVWLCSASQSRQQPSVPPSYNLDIY